MKHGMQHIGQHAMVIGSSMAGLLAARVLADRFERVTILERDEFPTPGEPRKGVPQGRHAHGLLAAGYNTLQHLFPGFEADMLEVGAVLGDSTGNGLWFQNGGYLAQANGSLRGVLVSRPMLEAKVRARVMALENVRIETGVNVISLASRNLEQALGINLERVIGVKLDRGAGDELLEADLVVDASGRGSRSPAWLEALGYAKPETSEVKIDMGYASRVYRRKSSDLNGMTHLIIAGKAPDQKRGGVLLAQENDRWIVTLTGVFGDYAPTDELGFLEFARSLPTKDLYDLLANAEPLGEITPYHYPSSLRRHFERLTQFPQGYLVLGDALCSFNPVFGQGMTVAALESGVLASSLEGGLENLWKRFFKHAAKVVDIPWTLAAGADLAFPEAVGKRGPEVKVINAYIGKLLEAAWMDPALTVAFHQVSNLLKPPSSLFAPNILWRVLLGSRKPTTPKIHHGSSLAAAGD
jgi:2-polyprenyl-6-methoxyphenol hydroxylase-like FAD-dependent oxidoreductase